MILEFFSSLLIGLCVLVGFAWLMASIIHSRWLRHAFGVLRSFCRTYADRYLPWRLRRQLLGAVEDREVYRTIADGWKHTAQGYLNTLCEVEKSREYWRRAAVDYGFEVRRLQAELEKRSAKRGKRLVKGRK